MSRNLELTQHFVMDYKVPLATALGVSLSLVIIRRYLKGAKYYGTTRIDGKVVIITGANTGIGKETAIDLAKRGAGKIIIACRDMDKANKAAEEIIQKSGNQNIFAKKLDLASLKSVRSFAQDVNKTENKLDILINNAGIMACPHWKTEDGFEMQFGVNHLGHFLLTNLLLDLLKKSAPSRIVTVSSMAHERGKMKFDDINADKEYQARDRYSQSKLANVLFSRELAKRLNGTKVTTYSLHPGVINTELARHLQKDLKWKVLFYAVLLFIKTPVEGAQTTIYCAVDGTLANETGKYYSDCAEKTPSKEALDDGSAKKLWELSEKMVGL